MLPTKMQGIILMDYGKMFHFYKKEDLVTG